MLAETDAAAAARSLLSAAEVRERARRMLQVGLEDRLPHFRVDLRRLNDAADLTIAVTRQNYPSLEKIPLHARWRHFEVDGKDRWAAIADARLGNNAAARARVEFDLAIISVLLDAGAGTQWRYHDAMSGRDIGRSEGLAVASLTAFADGIFSARVSDSLRADAAALAGLTDGVLALSFQASPANRLPGIPERANLLRTLGRAVAAAPAVFARHDAPRPGGLFDHLAAIAGGRQIAAATILAELLKHLGPIWPSRVTFHGVPLGDCWRHPAITSDDATDGLVPLHKLSQWLAYSLIEPLQRAGIAVTDVDGLTGLAEYRNGGLFIDTGTLALRRPEEAQRCHAIGDALVVEWRALTVALLDRLAELVRHHLSRTREELSLGMILQGGTWAAGRAIARRLRPDGSPPLQIVSDATVF